MGTVDGASLKRAKRSLLIGWCTLYTPTNLANTIPAYDRSQWNHWIDSDHDCQDTRHELLLRESLEPVTFSTISQCRVVTGLWYGQYLGIVFSESSDLDLDHIIPLKWAHDHGGWRWSGEDKQRFANDYQNLILVDDGSNQSKGARGPGEWMPGNLAYHCQIESGMCPTLRIAHLRDEIYNEFTPFGR